MARCAQHTSRAYSRWLLDFGDEPPYVSAIEQLDFAVQTAAQHNIQVVIDLHALPGSQNGWDHSGRAGKMAWHTKKQHIERTLQVLEQLAHRYANAPNLFGIEVINEPHWNIPKRALARYYKSAYQAVRAHCAAHIAVIISDSFRPYDWADVLPAPAYQNVMIDRHFYQCFSDADKALSMPEHIAKASHEWRDEIAEIQKSHPLIAGEWSLALDARHDGSPREDYAAAQITTFNAAAAWFFWTYKTEDSHEWDMRRSATTLGLTQK
jgi:glucan 1,3-beta-glucosidase